MSFKCSCGCGQVIPDGSEMVGVPIGNGNFLAFDPHHHQGQQLPIELLPYSDPLLAQDIGIAAENPLTKKETADVKKMIRKAKTMKGKYPKGVADGMQVVVDRYGPKKKGQRPRRNIAPVVIAAAPVAARYAVKHGPKAVKAAQKALKKTMKKKGRNNPRKAPKEFWDKVYPEIYNYYRYDRGYTVKRAKEAAGGTTRNIWAYEISPSKKRAYEAMRRFREGKGRFKVNEKGTINVDGSQVTEIRYIEKGTGIPYKHKLVKSVRMKTSGRTVIVPPMKVSRRGITQ